VDDLPKLTFDNIWNLGALGLDLMAGMNKLLQFVQFGGAGDFAST